MKKIENWSLVIDFDPYTAPEAQNIYLKGVVYGHSRFSDGDPIITSNVKDLDIPNGKAKTHSGSEYVLGKPEKEWMDWLKKNNYTMYLEDLEKLTSKFLN